MDITKIISLNLTAWMDNHPDFDTLQKLSKSSHVGFGTIRRAKNGDGNITVQNLELIAHAFKRKATDLLTEPTEITQTQPEPTGYELAMMRDNANVTSYTSAGKSSIYTIQEPPTDERELLQGYRDASPEVREIMLEAARRAIKKHKLLPNSEAQ